jgi:hypothetical protein
VGAAHGDAFQAEGVREIFRDAAPDHGGRAVARGAHRLDDADTPAHVAVTVSLARRSAKSWPLAERLAPAVAALVDWDPGDLPIVPVLLGLPDVASREALRQRAIAWSANI